MKPDSLADTIVPKSDQLNADDLLTGPITVKVESVKRGDKEQPVVIGIDGGRQPYKPCKSMRRVLIAAWGDKGSDWVGKSMTLYCDPGVVFGGVKVGGIRISHLSHIDSDRVFMLTATRGKKAEFTVKRLVTDAKPAKSLYDEIKAVIGKATAEQLPAMKDRVLLRQSEGKLTDDEAKTLLVQIDKRAEAVAA